jgi:hypothetical protein
MTFTEFSLSVIASIVAALIFAIGAKVTLLKWKKIAIGFGALLAICAIGTVVVFAGITVTKEFTEYRTRSALQEKIDSYTKGHYPEDYEEGFRVEVTQVGERPFLAFMFPDGVSATPTSHPWSNDLFTNQIQTLLNDNGYPGAPAWGYQMKPLTEEQFQQLLKRKHE